MKEEVLGSGVRTAYPERKRHAFGIGKPELWRMSESRYRRASLEGIDTSGCTSDVTITSSTCAAPVARARSADYQGSG